MAVAPVTIMPTRIASGWPPLMMNKCLGTFKIVCISQMNGLLISKQIATQINVKEYSGGAR